jgi:hypothetical protein
LPTNDSCGNIGARRVGFVSDRTAVVGESRLGVAKVWRSGSGRSS